MQKIRNFYRQLQNSINSRQIDFQLFQNLKESIININIDDDIFNQFVKYMTSIYELSNNEKLYTVKRTSITINQMAIQLKILVCKMMTMIIQYFERQRQFNLIPFQILSEAIQIMIICTRVCLNQSNNKNLSIIQECYHFIHGPFQYVAEYINKKYQFLHQLNVIQLMKYKADNQNFSIMEFKKRLSLADDFQQYNQADYKRFIQNIVMEIVLKSLKNGKIKPQNIKSFYSYLSQQNIKDINCLVFDPNNAQGNLQNASQFLQIYKQIKQHGIESINIEFLQEFIKKQSNFNDQRIFQIAALTEEPIILDIWFTILSTKKQKCLVIEKAFMCYIHLVECILHKYATSATKQALSSILKLSNSVTYGLLTEKKNQSLNLPFLSITKNLIKVLSWLCFSLYEKWNEIKDYAERIVLLCSRFQCMQVVKVIYSILLYYCLIRKQKAEEIYQRFVAHHNNATQSEIYKLLSCAYQVRNSSSQIMNRRRMQQISNQIKKQPFVGILFAQRDQDMVIFELDYNKYKQIDRKMYIYSQMLKKYKNKEQNVKRMLNHLQQYLIKIRIEEFQKDLQNEQQNTSVQQLFLILIDLLQKHQNAYVKLFKSNKNRNNQFNFQQSQFFNQNIKEPSHYNNISNQICFILINLYLLGNQQLTSQFKNNGVGVLLNKYSLKVKILHLLIQLFQNHKMQISPDMYQISSCYLITVLNKFKHNHIQKTRIAQPGQISFAHAISQLINVYHEFQNKKLLDNQIQIDSRPEQSKRRKMLASQQNQFKKDFLSFIIFQINCLTNNFQQYFHIIDKQPLSLLKAFSHSLYVPKNLKQKILRQLVKKNIVQSKYDISLKQFKEIIEITEDIEEVKLYIQYAFSNFGEQGKKMIMLMANQNKRIQQILLSDSDFDV